MVLGDSGAGKSRLVAEALLHGAQLIGDDQLLLSVPSGQLHAAPAPNIAGLLELHGFGIARVPQAVSPHRIHAVVQLSAKGGERHPNEEYYDYSGSKTPIFMLKLMHVPSLLLALGAMQKGCMLPSDWHASLRAS